ncbi:hypothetical protein BGZ82_006140 [Podila clonocystis]|nr:hypothetical protein BGZ82_006140 [Podila clonocystis]
MVSAKLCLLLALSMAVQIAHGAPPGKLLTNNDVCTSAQCVTTAADIIRDMRVDVDPCEDFSSFACGGFEEREEIPADEESVGYFKLVQKQNNRIIHSILSPESNKHIAIGGDQDSDTEDSNLQKLRALFTSCMDEDQINKVGRQPVVDEVKKLLALFPIRGSLLSFSSAIASTTVAADPDKATALAVTLGHMTKLGLDSFTGFGVSTNVKNPNSKVLVVSEGGLGLPSKEYYLDSKTLEIYELTVGQMLNLILGQEAATAPPSSAETSSEPSEPILSSKNNVDQMYVDTEETISSLPLTTSPTPGIPSTVPAPWSDIAKDIVAFEVQLAAISTNINDLRNSEKTYNPRTLAQIAELTPAIDWPTLLENTLAANTQVPDPIIVSSPDFHTRLQQLLEKTSTTTLQNYFTWSLIRQLAGNLSMPYRQPLRELYAVLSGISAGVVPDRWKTCVGFVNANLGDMAGQYFIEQAFKGNSRDVVNSLIDSLRATYTKGFPELDWLDTYTKKGASEKMSTIVQLIGFSTESPNVGSSKSLQEYYEGYQVDTSDYFGNKMRANLWGMELDFKDLNEPVNKLKMHMSPQTVNAYYSATLNEIVFPAGILQQPFFHVENPEYVNYGGIGVVAGHELGHGFDNRGRLFDSAGRMVNWWSNSTLEAFQGKAKCFVEQYGNFTVKGADGNDYHLNGELTLGENIADNGGLKKSYESWVARYRSDPKGKRFMNFKLPGLESLTPEQLFFVSYARPWCRKQRPASVVKQIRTDPHSPAEWRINGAVQNSVYFSEAFKCKSGARMNPKNKCDLW